MAAQPAGAATARAAQAGADPVVRTSNGAVRGIIRTKYNARLGIPYAAAPVGDLRFRAPQPAARWSGTRDANHFGDPFVQGTGWDPCYEQNTVAQDCLYLNVYVPHEPWSVRRSGKRPVFVWIHGGGFTGGDGQDTDPRKYIGQSGAVYVRQLAQWTRVYVYEFDETQTPQFHSIFRLQWAGDRRGRSRSAPRTSTSSGTSGSTSDTLPFSDDQLELSDQMIGFWASFGRRGNPNGDYLPSWPRFNGSQEWMSLDGCETAESSDEPPAACSEARDISDLIAIHQLDLWASVLSA